MICTVYLVSVQLLLLSVLVLGRKGMDLFTDTVGIRKRKNRPRGTVPEGMYDAMLEEARKMGQWLSSHDGVVGITLCGGISRGYADELSEIDLMVYLDNTMYRYWLAGKGPVPQGDFLWENKHFDISFSTIWKERNSTWSLLKKWDASYEQILHDPLGEVARLLDEKDIFTAREKAACALENYLKCEYLGDLVVRQWIKREDPLSANLAVNNAIQGLVNLVFLANDEYPPYEKWSLNYTCSLTWLPDNWKEKLQRLLLVRELTLEEAEGRSRLLLDLYRECWKKIAGPDREYIGLIELHALERLQYIIDHSPSLVEFTMRYNLKDLSSEPLYKLTKRVIEQGGERVVFDEKKYFKQVKKGFRDFLDWNREMLGKIVVEGKKK